MDRRLQGILDSITIDAKKMKGKKITINSKQFIKSYVNRGTETELDS